MNQPKRPAAPSGKATPKGQVPPRGGKGRPKSTPKPTAARPTTRTSTAEKKATGGSNGAGPRASTATGASQGPAWERRRQQRQRRNVAAVASIAVVALIVVLVVIKVATGNGSSKAAVAPSAVVGQATSVPVSAMVAAAGNVGVGSAALGVGKPPGSGSVTAPINFAGPPMTANGKPSILYIGAEYCPYCAAERWPMVMALAKFGTFTNLGVTTSSSSDANPNTPTFSFHGSMYSSQYVNFTGVEEQDRTGGTLDKLTPAQDAVVKKYDFPPYVSSQGSIPFVIFGGKYLISGASYDASPLANLSVGRAADILSGNTDAAAASTSKLAAVSLDTKATAAHIVGIVCSLTNNQPANVCSQVPNNLKQGGGASSGKGSG
ncbi:MAG: DUF929 domain-containing protein [Actinomycetota bacterium]|nr:DUF929 domain-containing protein [Actinomycetota bacterium]